MSENLELAVSVKGEIVTSNFSDFAQFIRDFVAGINTDPKTDLEFGQAETDVKSLATTHKAITDAKTAALEQMESVNELFQGLEEVSTEVNQKRLNLAKTIKRKKEEIKKQIENDAVDSIGVEWREQYRQQVVAGMKGKRNLSSLQEGAELAAHEVNELHKRTAEIVAEFAEIHGASICPDRATLMDMQPETLRAHLTTRAEVQAAEKKRIAAEKELAEMKRKEAEQSKPEPVKAEPLPEAMKVSTIPVKNTPTAGDEFNHYKAQARATFAQLKQVAASLQFEENKEKVKAFSAKVNQAWGEVMS